MRRAGFVVAATTALTLGTAGQGWAETTSGDFTTSWGDRTHIQMTWVDRNSFHNGALAVADQTCDDRSVYATLTIQTGTGAAHALSDNHNTDGCGTTTDFQNIAATDPTGIKSLTMTLCRSAPGTPAECETGYVAANPYYGS
ncbi:hypothetical protein [Streptomyces sp. NPDC056948]|uniref:hypothetical protein n=1 Tax=Streptomyces sp. NPDC056948 TaxID=3345975 RepID=UPI0036308CAB